MRRFFIALFFIFSLSIPILSAASSEARPIISVNIGQPYRVAYYPEPVYVERPTVYVEREHHRYWNCRGWRCHHRHDHGHHRGWR